VIAACAAVVSSFSSFITALGSVDLPDATRRIDQFLAGAVRPGQIGELVAQRSRG
jgi:hypothetical protein